MPTKMQEKIELTDREKKVLSVLKNAKSELTLSELARKAFPGVRPVAKANSWVRNQMRNLREYKLVKKIGEGTYIAKN